MKHLTFSLLFITFSTSISFAQDLITKKNGEDIKAKVLEVTPTEIKFNKLEIPNGPIFSILKSEVLIIRYENGSKDVFNETQQVTAKNNMPDIEKKQIEKKVATVIKISYGVKAGINYANLTNSFFDTKSILSYHFGGFAEIKFNDNFSIQPELQFSSQGAQIKSDYSSFINSGNYDPIVDGNPYQWSNLNLKYLNFPILAKFNATKNINLVVGPQIGLLMSVESDLFNSNFKNSCNSSDFSLNIGGGLTFEKIIIDFRYNIGLTSIQESSGQLFSDSKNSVLQLSLGYKF